MEYWIEKAEARKNYRLWVRFKDGMEGEIDLSNLIDKGVFKKWKDPKEFEKVSVDQESKTVVWPGGLDLAPDALYEELKIRKAA